MPQHGGRLHATLEMFGVKHVEVTARQRPEIRWLHEYASHTPDLCDAILVSLALAKEIRSSVPATSMASGAALSSCSAQSRSGVVASSAIGCVISAPQRRESCSAAASPE